MLRILTGLALAVALPGVEVGHGLAHEHEQAAHVESSHHDDHGTGTVEHLGEHPHDRVSEAVRNKCDVDFVLLASAVGFTEPQSRFRSSVTTCKAGIVVDRATGPPPRVRAPPIA
jgi:hypothetical protein